LGSQKDLVDASIVEWDPSRLGWGQSDKETLFAIAAVLGAASAMQVGNSCQRAAWRASSNDPPIRSVRPLHQHVRLLTLAISRTAATVTAARASTIALTLSEVGPDVLATASGSIDLDDLTFAGGGPTFSIVIPALGTAVVGASGGFFDEYSGVSGPASFGPGAITFATAGTGDFVGVQAVNNYLFVPDGYVSDAPLSGTATYAGQTFATLGLTPGTYVYTYGAAEDAGTITVNIGEVVSAPEPTSLLLFGPGALGVIARMWRRKQQ
jgi:hypothetical protein